MEPFVFVQDLRILDPRSVFANRVCKLYLKGKKPLHIMVDELDEFGLIYNDFEEFVRNIYELIENEIPLFALYELSKHGASNWGFSKEEYNNARERTIKACEKYYE